MKHKPRKKLKSLKKSKSKRLKVARRRTVPYRTVPYNREIQEILNNSVPVQGVLKLANEHPSPPVRARRATPTTLLRYVEPGDYALVKQAAQAKGKSINMFIVGASLDAARKALDLEEPSAVGAAG